MLDDETLLQFQKKSLFQGQVIMKDRMSGSTMLGILSISVGLLNLVADIFGYLHTNLPMFMGI